MKTEKDSEHVRYVIDLQETPSIEVEEKYMVTHRDGSLIFTPLEKAKQVIVPLYSVGIAALIVMVSFFAIFRNYTQIPMTGPRSIATIVIIAGVITGMINFTYYFTKGKQSEVGYAKGIYWRNYPAVLLCYLIIITVTQILFFRVIGSFFKGASFDIYTATMMGTVLVSIVNYIMIYIANTLTPSMLIKSLIFIIIGGVSVAVITNKDQQWWIYNFSFLGTPYATNSWKFNLTLMFSAFLMIALVDYLFVFLYDILGKNRQLVILKYLLIATAICLGGVGFFPYDDSVFNQVMHNRSAQFIVYLFLILIVSIRWLLPSLSKEFLKISYWIGAGLVLMIFLFLGVGYLSLTVFQVIAFVLSFSWLLLLLQYLVDIVMNRGHEIEVVVTKVS